VKITFYGVRGSTPAPGVEFTRYGGSTSCVAVSLGDDDPHLVLDGGTGLQSLSRALDGRAFTGTILLGHLHWDHTHGLPFFRAGDVAGGRVQVLIPEQGDASDVMARVMSPPHFPVRLEDLNGDWHLGSLEPGEHTIEGFEVLALEIPHKASRTFGFRITHGARSLAYLSDHWPLAEGPGESGHGELHAVARKLCDGVDVLIHDAQYTADEFAARAHFGHSTIEYAIALAESCGVGKLVLFHHDPDRTDDALDAIVAGCAGARVAVSAAAEGTTIEL